MPSLGWGFLSFSLCLRFPFYLGPLSSVYLLVATKGLAAYSCFTTQSFWYSLKDLLAQLSASISSLVVSLYPEFMSTFVPPLHRQRWRTGFFYSLSFRTRFWVLAVSGFFRTYLTFNFLGAVPFLRLREKKLGRWNEPGQAISLWCKGLGTTKETKQDGGHYTRPSERLSSER